MDNLNTYSQKELKDILDYDFTIPPTMKIGSLQEILNNINNIDWPYEIDGAVIKLAGSHDRSFHGNKYYKNCIAYKFASDTVDSTILDIEYQVGRTGSITPVAHIEPIELKGTTVKKVTLHNIDKMKELGTGIGAAITVHKAGEIIPQVYNVKVKSDKYNQISNCPCCNDLLIDNKCNNDSCQIKIDGKIKNFCKKMKINGMGDAVVAGLKLKSVFDLYKLDMNMSATKCGKSTLGYARSKKILASIDSSKSNPYWQWVAALGIEGISTTVAKTKIVDADNHKLSGKVLQNFNNCTEKDLIDDYRNNRI